MKHFRRFIRRLFVVATSRTSRLNFVARIAQACCIATTSGGKGQLGVTIGKSHAEHNTSGLPPIATTLRRFSRVQEETLD
jgi:hypothetical protein